MLLGRIIMARLPTTADICGFFFPLPVLDYYLPNSSWSSREGTRGTETPRKKMKKETPPQRKTDDRFPAPISSSHGRFSTD